MMNCGTQWSEKDLWYIFLVSEIENSGISGSENYASSMKNEKYQNLIFECKIIFL